jgi:hypothetical protein
MNSLPAYSVEEVVGLDKLWAQRVIGNIDALRYKVESLGNCLILAPNVVVVQMVFDSTLQITTHHLQAKTIIKRVKLAFGLSCSCCIRKQ